MVLSCTCSPSAFRRAASVFRSSAEKLSSKTNTFGCLAMALAIVRRCFCPPETLVPPCAMVLSNRSGFSWINSIACAISAACCTSASEASGLPNRRLLAMVPENSTPFCGTKPICCRSSSSGRSRSSTPSSVMLPAVTSYRRGIRFTSVDLPQPVLPMIAVVWLGFAVKQRSVRAFSSACG